MKNFKGILCLIMALVMAFSLCATAFADGEVAAAEEAVVEDVVDEVAQKEAEAEAAKAAAEAEAAKVNDVVDLDAAAEEPEEAVAEEAVAEEAPAEEAPAEIRGGLSGPVLCLIIAAVLMLLGLGVVLLSNKKIKSGKKGKAAK